MAGGRKGSRGLDSGEIDVRTELGWGACPDEAVGVLKNGGGAVHVSPCAAWAGVFARAELGKWRTVSVHMCTGKDWEGSGDPKITF